MRHFNRLISVLALLLAASASQADNYFTIGENDTLSIAAGCDTVTVPVRSHFDGRVQAWNLTLTWPEGLEGIKVSEGPGMMSIPYRDSQGEEHNCNAVITALFRKISFTGISSSSCPLCESHVTDCPVQFVHVVDSETRRFRTDMVKGSEIVWDEMHQIIRQFAPLSATSPATAK